MTAENDARQYFAPEPSATEKALRDRFVEEYVKDWHPINAAIRTGFNITFANEYAPIFLGEPYVQRKIIEYKNKPREDDADRKESVKAKIEAALEAALACGDPKVSVAAAAKLGEMHGLMQAPDRSGEVLNQVVDKFKKLATVLPD